MKLCILTLSTEPFGYSLQAKRLAGGTATTQTVEKPRKSG